MQFFLTLVRIFYAWIFNLVLKKDTQGILNWQRSGQIRTEPKPMVGNEIPLQHSQMSWENAQQWILKYNKKELFRVLVGIIRMPNPCVLLLYKLLAM
jgi:hypothetical protein